LITEQLPLLEFLHVGCCHLCRETHCASRSMWASKSASDSVPLSW